MSQANKQVKIITGVDAVEGQDFEPVAFFDAQGNPVEVGGGGGEAATWATLSGKPAVIGAGATAAAARTAIGAGTSDLAVATTAPAALAAAAAVGTGTTAARADHVHAFPTAAQVGAAATSHTHTATQVTATAITPGTATTVQGILAELAARITALEAA